ncbi:NAD(P)-binding protein [Bimuria novae-zelandiae CBS 107.79]|uniref:NAD(P)-binding protein n=1 Tax=Bimuria novae-zelandiae CBS 107.79 TaxID=1447943 RepID=A0A6A5VH35_9PLEO|nr:NAD(P)-binding protein [Bimuria novae-zelandiae CBS 107.79]
MSSYKTSKIFVIGGTGAQGLPVIRGLVSDGKYHCKVLTRDANSYRAKQLAELPNVSLLEGTLADEEILRAGYSGCDGAFVNIDGFNTGEKAEIYWTIRAYELALECGIKFFVHGNLDFVYKKSGYDPKFRTGHYDGKGRMAEWILQQTKDNGHKMGAAIFTTGPYIEMSIAVGTPMTPRVEDGVVTWRVPLGQGSVVHVSLEDCAGYVRWLFDNPERANGMDLEVAIDHIDYSDLAKAFEKVTGHPARYIDTSLDEYWASDLSIAKIGDTPAGYNADLNDKSTMTVRQNFTGFWNLWKYSGQNKGVVRRDYALLDEILPHRIKSAEEWLRKEEERGRKEGLGGLWDRVQPANLRPILKIAEDGRSGKL